MDLGIRLERSIKIFENLSNEEIVEKVNRIIYRLKKEVEKEIEEMEEDGGESWYGMEDCNFDRISKEFDWVGNGNWMMRVDGDRGGYGVYFMFEEEDKEDEDGGEYGYWKDSKYGGEIECGYVDGSYFEVKLRSYNVYDKINKKK